ncbi:hypothetical protein L9G16_20135, partial [Shewanella sp. A25]|nr:hypothetical protein [Shewanella shenzhenensis]
MSRRKQILGWTFGVLGAALAATGLYTYHVYSAMEQTLHSVHQPVKRQAAEQVRPEPVVMQ